MHTYLTALYNDYLFVHVLFQSLKVVLTLFYHVPFLLSVQLKSSYSYFIVIRRGYAFVEFEKEEDMTSAYKKVTMMMMRMTTIIMITVVMMMTMMMITVVMMMMMIIMMMIMIIVMMMMMMMMIE